LSIGGPPIADFLHASLTGLVQVFAWPTFGLMLIGMALGFVVGHLPGLGGPTTLALMLPLFEKGLAVLFPPGQLLVWLGYGG
jgi:TctA family transporter